MAENDGQQATPTPPPERVPLEKREGAWQAVQQGAQVVGELGGGAYALARTAEIVHNLKGGGGDGSADPQPFDPPPQSPSDE